MNKRPGIAAACAGMALVVCVAAPTSAGDPGVIVRSVADAPPEAQVRMLKIVLGAVFGTPAEIKAEFIRECDARHKLAPVGTGPSAAKVAAPAASPPATAAAAQTPGLTKEAVLLALCAGPVRPRVEAALSPRGPASPAASASGASPGKQTTSSPAKH